MTPDLEKILTAALQAPSGENCQPWRFVVKGSSIEQWNIPERDQSPYSWGQRASYMANGAALENLVLAAGELGYEASVRYFPGDANHIATINLAKTGAAADPLSKQIFTRVSNRKPYKADPLTAEQKNALQSAAASAAYGGLNLTENRDEIKKLALVGSANEEVMLSNDYLHSFFFSHLNWTKEEDNAKKVGFYIKTLELPPPGEFAFKIIRHSAVIKFLRLFGFPKVARKQNGDIYAASAAIGAITGSGYEPIDFVKAGQTLQRVWLAATAQGLSFQPLTGILFFMLKVRAGDTAEFSPQEIDTIKHAYADIEATFGKDAPILFMFRIGKSDPASAQAVRFSVAESVHVA